MGGQLTDGLRPAHPLGDVVFNAFHKTMEGDAKRKYFEHAGALLTADGTDDDLIKFEGAPPGYRVQI